MTLDSIWLGWPLTSGEYYIVEAKLVSAGTIKMATPRREKRSKQQHNSLQFGLSKDIIAVLNTPTHWLHRYKLKSRR